MSTSNKTTYATLAILTAAIAVSALLLMAPMLAAAASPHFIVTPQITKNPNFSLTAKFKAAGLGNVVTDVFLTSSGGVAELQCVNPGGNNPPPKRVEFGPLQGETVTVQPRNGQVTASPTIGPPPLPGVAELCPNPNWSVAIVSLTYFDVELHIQQGGVDILTFDFGDVDPPATTALSTAPATEEEALAIDEEVQEEQQTAEEEEAAEEEAAEEEAATTEEEEEALAIDEGDTTTDTSEQPIQQNGEGAAEDTGEGDS